MVPLVTGAVVGAKSTVRDLLDARPGAGVAHLGEDLVEQGNRRTVDTTRDGRRGNPVPATSRRQFLEIGDPGATRGTVAVPTDFQHMPLVTSYHSGALSRGASLPRILSIRVSAQGSGDDRSHAGNVARRTRWSDEGDRVRPSTRGRYRLRSSARVRLRAHHRCDSRAQGLQTSRSSSEQSGASCD